MWRISYTSRVHILLKIEKNVFVYVCDMQKCVYACLHVCKINVWGYTYVMSGIFLGHFLPY